MITRHTRDTLTWVDLEAPTPDELHAIIEEFGVHPEIEEEIISPTPYPLVAFFPDHIYLVLHFPTADMSGGARTQEIDIIVGKHFLITARYEVVGSIHTLHKAFEAEELLGVPTEKKDAHPALIERVMRRLYSAMSEEVEQTAQALDHIERDIFNGKEHDTVRSISEIGRVLLRFDTTLARHQEPLSAFLTTLQSTQYFGKGFALSAAHIEAERAHVAGLVQSYRAVARELRTTNDSLLSSSQNEVMKIFTALTVATLPLALIAGLFGMHVKYAPILGLQHDFWIIIGIMVLIEVALVTFLRFKRWI